MEKTDEAIQLLDKYQEVFKEEGEEAEKKFNNLRQTILSQQENGTGKEKLKRLRIDGLPMEMYNKDALLKEFFTEPKRINKISYK